MELEEVDICQKVDKKLIKVLKILMSGRTLKVGEVNVGLAHTIDDSLYFFIFYDNSNRVFGNFSFSQFYKELKNISEEEITCAIAEISLQEFKNKSR